MRWAPRAAIRWSKSSGAMRPYPHFRSDEAQARPGGAQVATAAPRPLPADWQREADRVAAGQYVPPGVLIKDASYNYGQTKEKEDFS